MNCYNCDTILENNWNYCPNCKRKIKKKKENPKDFVGCNEYGKCHSCSCELKDTWNFCPICGNSVEFYSEKPQVILPTIATDTNNKPTIVPVIPVEEITTIEVNTNRIYCPNCGAVATEEHLFCASCGSPIKQNSEVSQVNVNKELKDNNYLIWVIVTIVATPVGFLLGNLVTEELVYIGYLVSLFSIIYAKVKYPKNTLVKVVFWVFIILSILAIIAFILFVVAVIVACGSCAYSLG